MTTANHPPPSRMQRALFVEHFGEIFEHSPQIAERTYDAGLTPSHSTADALHAAMMRTVRTMSPEEKLALIRAHPELAGREAVAGTMTDDSKGEQGRLGFTALTRSEFERVGDINRRYRAKHGFQCIVALALHQSRDTVIAEMDRRISCDTDAEIETALEQIGHITKTRLAKKMAQK